MRVSRATTCGVLPPGLEEGSSDDENDALSGEEECCYCSIRSPEQRAGELRTGEARR